MRSTNAALAVPRVYAAVERLFDTMVERAADPDSKDYYASQHIAVAWRAGRYEAAARLMDRYGDRVHAKAFAEVLGWAPGAMSQVRLMTSPHATAAAEAEQALTAQDFAGAAAKYEALAAKLPGDHPGRLFVRYRLKAAQVRKAMAEGDGWVSLAPDADFVPWTVSTGDWKRTADGTIESTADETGQTLLLCRIDLGPAYEIRAKVDTPVADKVRATIPAVFVNGWYPQGLGVAAVTPSQGKASARGYRMRREAAVAFPGPAVVAVRVDGRRFDVTIDEQPVFSGIRLSPRMPAHDLFAGVGIFSLSPGGVARFSELQVRRLQPAAAK